MGISWLVEGLLSSLPHGVRCKMEEYIYVSNSVNIKNTALCCISLSKQLIYRERPKNSKFLHNYNTVDRHTFSNKGKHVHTVP